ncbi:MAG: hypothetical protein WA885_05355 [Phormidesmis sp.]
MGETVSYYLDIQLLARLVRSKRGRIRTNSKHTKQALKLCQENLEYLQEAVRKYDDAQ